MLTQTEREQLARQTAEARRDYILRFGTCPPPVKFTLEDAEVAGDQWQFNCGPASICAVTGMRPSALRPHMLDFERKGYTNPTLMLDVLRGLRVEYRRMGQLEWPRGRFSSGLVRVQWGGPWCDPGVPIAARYRKTHWVASWRAVDRIFIFDVNAMCVGGWLPFDEWSDKLVPWIIKECVPKGDGRHWATHCLEIPMANGIKDAPTPAELEAQP